MGVVAPLRAASVVAAGCGGDAGASGSSAPSGAASASGRSASVGTPATRAPITALAGPAPMPAATDRAVASAGASTIVPSGSWRRGMGGGTGGSWSSVSGHLGNCQQGAGRAWKARASLGGSSGWPRRPASGGHGPRPSASLPATRAKEGAVCQRRPFGSQASAPASRFRLGSFSGATSAIQAHKRKPCGSWRECVIRGAEWLKPRCMRMPTPLSARRQVQSCDMALDFAPAGRDAARRGPAPDPDLLPPCPLPAETREPRTLNRLRIAATSPRLQQLLRVPAHVRHGAAEGHPRQRRGSASTKPRPPITKVPRWGCMHAARL